MWSLVLFGISKGKVKNLKIPGVFQKSISYLLNHPLPPPPVCFFSRKVHCDTSSIGRSTPARGVKRLLFSRLRNIFAVNILSKMGKIPSFIAFYKLFLSEIKIKLLINSWHFLMIFLDVPSVALRLSPSVFSKWKMLRYRTHTGQVLVIYWICNSLVLIFCMFSCQQKLSF